MNTAVLVVDMIKDFFTPEMTADAGGRERAGAIVAPLKDLLSQARLSSVPVVHVYDYFCPAEADIDAHLKLQGRHAVEGTTGVQVIDELAPRPEDYVVHKKVYDGFYGTRLDMVLRELKVERIAVTGIWANACVKHTVMGGWFRRYDTVLVKDCVTTKKEKDMVWALEYMQRYYGTKIMTARELVNEFC